MTPASKLYGYRDRSDEAELMELVQASLCFRSVKELREFGRFVLAYANEIDKEKAGDHEDFFADEYDDRMITVSLIDS
ncbi:hypothetical protein ACFQDZ_23240 [Sulfitobacter pacificus]|uniref:hypothetical protein n=1 Tax=Sulfitobacter pacificus TaxID=1499314 RepID=UPI003618762E